MSDNWLRYVPKDPQFHPTEDQARVAERLLASFFPMSEDVRSEFTDHPVFVHPGSNWSGVHCSSCGADPEAWWGDAMTSAAESNFTDLTVLAPCCCNPVSLNALNYVWPSAFGRYTLEAMNPNKEGLTSEQSELLAIALGCEIHEVPVHL